MKRKLLLTTMLLAGLLSIIGCHTPPPKYVGPAPKVAGVLVEYRQVPDQPTGIAISAKNRMFLSFPRWGSEPHFSVAEVMPDGTLRPYPDAAWNSWDKTPASAADHFVCVQSVYVDDRDNLWILDPASPSFSGVVKGGAKLVKVNLAEDRIEKVIPYDEVSAPVQSYLNDVRVDNDKGIAYITDSGTGAIVLTSLDDGKSRRLLPDHPSTKAEAGYTPVLDGRKLLADNGRPPQVHSDGIALSSNNDYLYYHALTGRGLYRVRTEYLREALSQQQLAAKVEKVMDTTMVDGMWMDRDNNLYLTLPEEKAIKRLEADGRLVLVVEDSRLHWPDTIAMAPDGLLYFTDSQINLMPRFNAGTERRSLPYKVYKVLPLL